jgi:hypothetical protein
MTSETDNSGEIAALRNQVFILLVALIVVSGTLTVILYRQVSITGKDIRMEQTTLNGLKPQAQAINQFVARLISYAQRHPDFVPVLKKYGINPNALPPPGASAVAPSVAPAANLAAPKKP